ncbi:acetylcholinesterase-like [Aricia agestis]|uniref:acetylcholinesterase-like n=1 Tax=Aricia agestis TaxID=91739 RepID=UPI001C203AB3|nr:acetylcholinesterase-like [Aricia agestis]XP_041984351.1 acetylcholinesterase-like [Aricia agestis]
MKWLVLWSLWAMRLARQPSPAVRVSGGALRGEVVPDGSHVRYLNVPYATHLERFQDSGPEPKWDRVFEAFEENSRCLQRFSTTWINGREDCLTLNVYTPTHMDCKLPVMVFIHGGGFRDGSSSPFIYGPEYLVRHDVILVTINYRLEILGFLNLGIKEAPGNVGIKDQVRALRWVKRNIAAFGGDPNRVTVFGESAGAASVMYHILSPMSKGLFHQAILQSGSAVSPWSFQHEPLEVAKSFVRQLGHETDDPYEIYKALSQESPVKLLETRVPRKSGDVVLSENIFVPSIEKDLGLERFLPDSPYNLLMRGDFNKVPILMGYNNAEGFYFTGRENATTIPKITFVDSLPRDLRFPTQEEKLAVGKRLKELYLGDRNITKDTIPELAKYEGDSGIVYPVVSTIDYLKKATGYPVYAYKFCRGGWRNLMKIVVGKFTYPGAVHADELFYMFKFRLPFLSFVEVDVTDKVSTLWTNFAKYGNPTPETTKLLPVKWEPLDKRDEVLHIDKELKMAPLWDDEAILYWHKVYYKYRRKT